MNEPKSRTGPRTGTEKETGTENKIGVGSTSETLKGSVKEAIGKLIGDGRVEAEGKSQQDSKSQQNLTTRHEAEPRQKPPNSDVKTKTAPNP